MTRKQTLRSLMAIMKPYWPLILGAGFLGAATIFSNVGLLATSAILISQAALLPPILDLMVLIVGVRFFGISRALLRYAERYVTHDITLRILSKLRVALYQRLEPLAPSELESYSSGQLFTRLTDDIETLKFFYLRAVAVPLVASLVLVGSSIFIWQFSPRAAVILVIMLLLGGVLVPELIRRSSRQLAGEHGSVKDQLQTKLVDFIKGQRTIKSTNSQSEKLAEIAALQGQLEQCRQKLGARQNLTTNLITYFSNVALWLALVAIIPAVAGGTLSGVYLAMVILVVWASFEAVIPFPQALIQIEQSMVAAEHIFELMAKGEDVVKPKKSVPLTQYDLRVEQVDFHYGAEGFALYDQLSLTIPTGSKVALVGGSGSGKSTLVNLLLKFWRPDGGRITLGGYDLQAIPDEQLRGILGVVNQEPFLFNATVRDNLFLARVDADEAMLWQALTKARLAEDIRALAMGLDTFVGENGVRFSGGQRQRMALARVFLQDHPVIILDEATQGLDTVMADQLRQELARFATHKTLITITHNLQALAEQDMIYVFAHGHIVEQGTEQALLAQNGTYATMWQLAHGQF